MLPARSAIGITGFAATSALTEVLKHIQQDSFVRGAERFCLTKADQRASDQRALHRAAMFIVIGTLVILLMELAPEASARFGQWLGITGAHCADLVLDGPKQAVLTLPCYRVIMGGTFLFKRVAILLPSAVPDRTVSRGSGVVNTSLATGRPGVNGSLPARRGAAKQIAERLGITVPNVG